MKISVCLCTYNGEAFLREQLDTILEQTQLPDEIIIYDDASTDGTYKILNEYIARNKYITWKLHCNEANTGWKINFKNCIEQASGDIIFLCDQDDKWVPNKIEKSVGVMEQNKSIKLLVTQYTPLYMSEAREKNLSHGSNTGRLTKVAKNQMMAWRNGCVFSFRRELVDDFLKCWKKEYAHDMLLWHIAYWKDAIFLLDECLILFRRHGGNASSTGFKKLSSERMKFDYENVEYAKRILFDIENNGLYNPSMEHQMNKAKKWLLLRLKLYCDHSLYAFVQLLQYLSFYPSFKTYIKDFLPVLIK